MVNLGVQILDTEDLGTLLIMARITFGSEYDTEGYSILPLRRLKRRSCGNGVEYFVDVAAQKRDRRSGR